MNGIQLISVREHPEWTDAAIAFFQDAWATDDSKMVYEDCIRQCVNRPSALPQWYILTLGKRIVAGCGLIPNDFISRMDLWPWICALYVDPECRGCALGSELLRYAREDAARLGYPKVYLATDHVGYYEKYGFEAIAEGYHPWGERSRIYCAESLK